MALFVQFWDRLTNDLRYGMRMLLARPGFTAVAVLSIALGVAATTAIFSVVYAVLIDPYPYRAAGRIGSLHLSSKKDPDRGVGFSKAQYLEIKSRMRSMEDAVAADFQEVIMTGSGPAEVVKLHHDSPNFFDFMDVRPLLGREFGAKDMPHGAAPDPVAVISYKFWQHAFQGDRDVLGKQIRLNDDLYTIVGVLPVRFTWGDMDVYVPMDMRPSTSNFVDVQFRIRPGVTQDQVQTEFGPLLEGFRRQVPSYMYPQEPFKVKFVSVNDSILGKFENTLLALFGAVALLLLIACANVANLLLARATAREGEMTIRISVGATRMRLIRQLLTESVLLAVAGGSFGVALAYGAVRAIVALMPEYSIPHEAVIALNWPVLWFALGISVLTGLVFGIAPALQVSGETQAEGLRSSGRGAGVGARSRGLHNSLIVAEVVLSLVLLTGAGLAINGLFALERQNLGYNPRNALTFRIPLSETRYKQWSTRLTLFQNMMSRMRRLPQVKAAAISGMFIPPYGGMRTKAMLDDRPASEAPDIVINLVDSDYFESVGTRLLRGRKFTQGDILQAKPVALISEDEAKRDFHGKDPIGHHIQVDLFNQPIPPQWPKAPAFVNSFEIVGVVGTARNRGLTDAPEPALFVPYSIIISPSPMMILRTQGDPEALIGSARQVVRSVEQNQPITEVRTLEGWLNTATAYAQFSTFLFGIFGAIGLTLASAGVFSVVSYAVAHRTREFGIRMALGAKPRDVLQLVVTATGRVVAVGMAVGILISIETSRLLADKMQGMGSSGPLLFTAVPAILLLAAMIACVLPVRTATRIQPTEALRHE
ncbi:MAG TPA: ABC transporter permease [Bryobacteraceae bacterium]|nr:ABC transporter permease [Bryobacteraceae bacterium]